MVPDAEGSDGSLIKCDLEVVYCISPFRNLERSSFVAPLPFGLASMRFITEGTELIIGVPMEPTKTLTSQISSLKSLDSGGINTIINSPNHFACILKPGQLLYLPCGFIYIMYSASITNGMMFGFTSGAPEEDTRVTHALHAMIEATPQLRDSPYTPWLRAHS